MSEVFELRPYFEWRGLGFIAQSALKLSPAYADLDAELRLSPPGVRVADPKACQCGEVLKGVLKPPECKVFGTSSAPKRSLGALMVSSEGACAAYYNFGRKSFEKVEIGSQVSGGERVGAGFNPAPTDALEQNRREAAEVSRAAHRRGRGAGARRPTSSLKGSCCRPSITRR